MTEEVKQMDMESLVVKQFCRMSPSRYTAMHACLLREVWSASGNEPLLPSSPLAELGSVIHRLLEVAGRGQLDGGQNGSVNATWGGLISQAEKRMALSALRQHQVPLSRSIPDFEVRKLRACRRAAEIAHDAFRADDSRSKQSPQPTGFELWVESDDGQVGGYIDRVTMTKKGVVLSDYKSGSVLESGIDGDPGELKRAYKVQLKLYAALYRLKYGAWPIRLEVVPLQGNPIEVVFDPEDAEHLLAEAIAFLHSANERIVQVKNGSAVSTVLASPRAMHCRFCLFRPACRAYWIAKRQESEGRWPVDVLGIIKEMTRLRNGKVCMRVTEADSPASSCITVRNLTDCANRHPLLHNTSAGTQVAIYGLKYDYRSDDYAETQNTVIYRAD